MKQLVLGIFLSVAALASTSSFASNLCDKNSISDLTAGSYPCFVTPVEFKYKEGKGISAKYKDGTYGPTQSVFFAAAGNSNSYSIFTTSFNFDATIDSDNKASGSVSIYGSLGAPGPASFLMSANLAGDWAYAGTLIGFDTKDIVCGSAITALLAPGGCTTSEVVYFDLADAFDPSDKKFKSTGLALTSVPLPAAVWLFGTGLLSLAGIAQRRSKA